MKYLKSFNEALKLDLKHEKFTTYKHRKEIINELKNYVLGLCEDFDCPVEEVENCYHRRLFGLEVSTDMLIISGIPEKLQDELFEFLIKHQEWLSRRIGWNVTVWQVPGDKTIKDMICIAPFEKLDD